MNTYNRIAIIELMRGVAAIAVALYHFTTYLKMPVMQTIHSVGWLGVDVFFVISGFVIPLSLHGRGYRLKDFGKFLLRRVIRLEPAYLASIVLVLVLWHVSAMLPGFRGEAPSYSAGQVASHLFYAIPLTRYEWFQPVYWTLAYEFVFYIVIGLTFSLLFGRAVEFTVGLSALIILALMAATGAVDARILEFMTGVLMMRAVVEQDRRALAWSLAVMAGVFWFGGALTGAAAALAAMTIFFFHRVQLGAWATAIGAISYSLYLTHGPVGHRVMNLGLRFVEGPVGESVLLIAALGVSITFAVLFARLFEAPALAVSRKVRMTAMAR